MAGPSSISGVAGNLGFMPGPDYSPIEKMAGSIVAAYETKKQHAAQEFDRLMSAVNIGLPVDPKQIEKTLKQSGVKLMKPEDMKAFIEGQKNGTDPTKNVAPPGTSVQKDVGGTQSLTGQVTDATKTSAVTGAKQKQQQAVNSLLDGFVKNAMHAAQLKNETAENQAKLANKLSQDKLAAANGDGEALGRLMAMNEIPFNIQAQAWNQGTPEQRKKMMDTARGAETEAQFTQRKTQIYDRLMADGRFKDPSQGMKAAEIIAKGGELPSDIRNAMTPNTMSDLVKESELGLRLVELGVPPEQVNTIAANAQKVGLAAALPQGLKPLATQQLEFEKTRTQAEVARVGLEAERFKAETAHYQAMAAAMDAKMKEEGAKADLEQFKSLVELKKISGSAVTDDMIRAAQTKAMRAMGWTEEETKGFWNRLTGGFIPTTNKSFRPNLTPNSQNNIDRSIGGNKTSDSTAQNTVGAIGTAIKKPGSGINSSDEGGPY